MKSNLFLYKYATKKGKLKIGTFAGRTQVSIFGEQRVQKTVWVQNFRLKGLLVISIKRLQASIRVDGAFTQDFFMSRHFPIAIFGGINHDCRFEDAWVLKGTIFQFWEYFWNSQTIKITTQSSKSEVLKSSSLPKKPKTEVLQLEVRSVALEEK